MEVNDPGPQPPEGTSLPLSTVISSVEHIFNRLRWKYLRAIVLSQNLRASPAQAVSMEFNEAFLSLVGLTVPREHGLHHDNDGYWQNKGFDPRAKYELDWKGEREILNSLLQSMISAPNEVSTFTYGELIALKPGFHEAWQHKEFPNDVYEGPETPRGRVFAILRGSSLPLLKVKDGYPADFARPDDFLSYAPCAVTEGPMVQRRNAAVSYFSELQRVGKISRRIARQGMLNEAFFILDIWQRLQDENHAVGLDRLIDEAESLCNPSGGASS